MPIEKVHEFTRPDAATCRDLVRRAIAAWIAPRREQRESPNEAARSAEIPDSAASAVRMHKGLGYVVLHGDSGVLAVYRIRPDTLTLRLMKRWPAAIERREAAQ